jgi:hypothetical protein
MGVDPQALRFLLRSRSTVSFERFLTLGRQACHVSRQELERQLRQNNFPLTNIRSAIEAAHTSRFIEPVLELLGARDVESLDFSDYEQATIVHDMNKPIPENLKGRYSCVFDGGTLEHVFDFPQAIENAMEMVAVGGHFLGVGPVNNFPGHGFYQFSPELYWRIFSEPNGYAVEEMLVCENRPGAPCYRIEDPVRVGRRVQFTNSRPAYVMVRARRLRQREIFKGIPQQSDYVTVWSSQTGSGAREPRQGPESVRDWAKRVVPEPIKKILRPWWPEVRRLSLSGFKKI